MNQSHRHGQGAEPRSTASSAMAGLPAWASVLAVVAHPDDESFGLGAVLDAFASAGAGATVLCLTRGEASTIAGAGTGISGDLASLRAAELRSAAQALGVRRAELREHPDGALGGTSLADLAEDVAATATAVGAEGLLVFDPSGVSGHPDHVAATAAALRAAEDLDLPVLGWTVPEDVAARLNTELETSFTGHPPGDVDLVLPVRRDRQRVASLAHASQAVPTSVLWRRLELQGDVEHLRWLRRRPDARPAPAEDQAVSTMLVTWSADDRFDVSIRDHVVTVDQPPGLGGGDVGPTPTELFVAGLASCVAFYARRYLRRHHLDADGLTVRTRYRMGAKPARVSDVVMEIELPRELPENRRAGLLAMAGHCTVHNSITTAPDIQLALRDG